MDAPTASRTHAPASPRGNVYITLHLHLAFSGEFIIAHRVPLDECVERYVQDLEEGCIEPSLRIPVPELEGDDEFRYDLVWKDMELECGRKFIDYVEEHGMPVDVPVDIMVVMHSTQRAVVDEC